jgi:hypothetical protein
MISCCQRFALSKYNSLKINIQIVKKNDMHHEIKVQPDDCFIKAKAFRVHLRCGKELLDMQGF